MATLKICNWEDAKTERHNHSLVVSLLDININNKMAFGEDNLREGHKIFNFDDVLRDSKHMGFVAPTMNDVVNVLKFVEKHLKEDSSILVHCHAGISRSTAIAVLICIKFLNMKPDEALLYVHSIRKQSWPNELIIALGDEHLGLNGELIKAHEDWKKAQPKLIW